jgi:glycyl-tRNA synthetase beta chain
MVREFPELQGVMGGIYLRAEGHASADVVAAVRWHYHPVSIEEGSPPALPLAGLDARIFGAVSLADKLDLLAGYFGIGLAPSGSSDPFGLRRAGQGAIRVLLDFWMAGATEARPDLRKLVASAIAGYGTRLANEVGAVRTALEAFLLDRLRYVFSARGFPADEVDAVLNAAIHPLDDVFDCWLRLKALSKVRREYAEEFEHLSVAFKRANNIIEKAEDSPLGSFEKAWLEQGPEAELLKAIEQSRQGWQDTRGLEEYERRLRSSALLRSPVDVYFDKILVMHEDAKLRRNRLGFLAYMVTPINRIADISRLGG